jgi:hypothetical protein
VGHAVIRSRTPVALRSRSFRGDRLAWAALLVALVALATAGHAWLHRRVADERPAPDGVREFKLVVLAYERVARGTADRHLDPARLAEHLGALAAAGFRPVSLRQVSAAYHHGGALPERAVLLTFDGGHLSTYQAVDPLLRRRRWPAVMFVDARLPEGRHSTYVYWDRLERMVASGLWDVGVVPPWRDQAALVSRRLRGHAVLGVTPGPRPADPDVSDLPAPALAFENGLFGVNDVRSDARRLFRVRVDRGWSGRQLVERLAASLAAPTAAAPDAAAPVEAARWVRAVGDLDVGEEGATLAGGPRGEAWLAGAEWAHDFVLEAEVRAEEGPFWIVQQAVGSREQWRWGGTDRALYLQRLRPGAPLEVVSQVELRSEPGAWHRLRLVKRGGGVWIEWDGARVAGKPRGVEARWRGPVGIATGSAERPGRVSVRRVRFAAIPYEVRPVSGSPEGPEVQALLGEASRVAAISPPGLVDRDGALVRAPTNDDLIMMLAARGAWDVVPSVTLSGAPADPARADEVADLAAARGWAGVRLVPEPGDGAPAAAWARAFEARGLRLVVDASGGPQ